MRNVIFLTSFLCLLSLAVANECFKLDLSLTQKVENEGFHRNINWLLEMHHPKYQDWMLTSCNITLMFDVNAGLYVNPDEVAETNRLLQTSIRVTGKVNVETPAHESDTHIAYVYVPSQNTERIPLQLPIHLRYQRAQITGGFGKVHLHKPSLLLTCPDRQNVCGKFKKVQAPCNLMTQDICTWKNVTYNALFEDVELFVPIGDLDDYPLVSIVSLLLGCAGCIYILSILSTAPL